MTPTHFSMADKRENEIVGGEPDEGDELNEKKRGIEYER